MHLFHYIKENKNKIKNKKILYPDAKSILKISSQRCNPLLKFIIIEADGPVNKLCGICVWTTMMF